MNNISAGDIYEYEDVNIKLSSYDLAVVKNLDFQALVRFYRGEPQVSDWVRPTLICPVPPSA